MVRVNIGRSLVGVVLIINLQCAFSFIFSPELFTDAYELMGNPGEAAIRGVGVLFTMWSVPYIVAIIHPVKYRVSLLEAIIMQSLGLIGETYILFNTPTAHNTLIHSIQRFIFFDAAGLLCLLFTAGLLRNQNSLILTTD
jgi:hypothetical protein